MKKKSYDWVQYDNQRKWRGLCIYEGVDENTYVLVTMAYN